MAFLALDHDDYRIAAAVVRAGDELRVQREKQVADYQAGKTANLILPGLIRAVNRMLRG